jgi:hypothetical protein
MCVVVCVGLIRQDGQTYFSAGSIGLGVNVYTGDASYCAPDRAPQGLFASGGVGFLSVGVSHGVYDTKGPHADDQGDNEVDLGFGVGFSVGIQGIWKIG